MRVWRRLGKGRVIDSQGNRIIINESAIRLRDVGLRMQTRAERIRYLRESMGLAQGPFADLLGVSRPALRNWERRSKELGIARHNLSRVAQLTGASIDWIEHGHGEIPIISPKSNVGPHEADALGSESTGTRYSQESQETPDIQYALAAIRAAIQTTFLVLQNRAPTEIEMAALVRSSLALFEAQLALNRPPRRKPANQTQSVVADHTSEPITKPS